MEFFPILLGAVLIIAIVYRLMRSSNGAKNVGQSQSETRRLVDVLSGDAECCVRESIAWNGSTPAEVLSRLSSDSEASVRIGVAQNENTSKTSLEILSKDVDLSVRREVASNKNTPRHVLEMLIADDSSDLASSTASFAAQNPNISPGVLRNYVTRVLMRVEREQGGGSAGYVELWGIAANPSMPQDALEILLTKCPTIKEYDAKNIKHGIASNPGASLKLLSLLAQDDSPYVRYGLETNPQAPQSVLRICYKMYGADEHLAENRNTPQDIIEKCAHNENVRIRAAAARNTSAAADTLSILASDSNEDVRGTVAQNPNTPQELVERLSLDESEYVRSCVAKNPMITHAIAEGLVVDKGRVREGLALNPSVSEDILDRLSKDENEEIRVCSS